MTRDETSKHEKIVHDLCRQAVSEKDIDKLLQIFLALHRVAEPEPQRMTFGRSSH